MVKYRPTTGVWRRLVLGLLLLSGAIEQVAAGQGLVFRIEHDGHPDSYLVGTMHSEDPRVTALMTQLTPLIAQVDLVAVEMVPDVVTMLAVGAASLLPAGQDLRALLGMERFARLAVVAKDRGIPLAALERLKELMDAGITEIPVLDIDNITVGPYMRNTMATDKNMNRDTALMDIYRVMRPGEPPTVEAATTLFDSLFFWRSLLSDSLIKLLAAACFLLAGLLVAVGERGHVLRSEDGATWEQAEVVPTQVTLTTVESRGGRLWAAGHDAVIITSGDNGQTWTLEYHDSERQQAVMDLYFTDEFNGVAIGSYSLYLRTSDGGRTWEDVTIDEEGGYHLNAMVRFEDGRRLIAGDDVRHELSVVDDSGEVADLQARFAALGDTWQKMEERMSALREVADSEALLAAVPPPESSSSPNTSSMARWVSSVGLTDWRKNCLRVMPNRPQTASKGKNRVRVGKIRFLIRRVMARKIRPNSEGWIWMMPSAPSWTASKTSSFKSTRKCAPTKKPCTPRPRCCC